jgi:hypothetical protein
MMGRAKVLAIVACATTALMLASTLPAAAAPEDGVLAVVNGRPGGKVDVCLNGKEIRSGLAYGGKATKRSDAGTKTLKFFKAGPGKCKGKVMAKTTFVLTGDTNSANHDFTLVLTTRFPNVLVFENSGLGRVPPNGPPLGFNILAFRDASDLGPLNLFQRSWFANPGGPLTPAVAVWDKGDQYKLSVLAESEWKAWVTRPEQTARLVQSKRLVTTIDRRYELLLVGSSRKNARFVVVARGASQYN